MDGFGIIGDPARRRILELLARRPHASGEVATVLAAEFSISQAGASQHLKVLRESGFARVRAEGARRIYHLEPLALAPVAAWLEPFGAGWTHKLGALETEIARGKRDRRRAGNTPGAEADAAEPAPAPRPAAREAR